MQVHIIMTYHVLLSHKLLIIFTLNTPWIFTWLVWLNCTYVETNPRSFLGLQYDPHPLPLFGVGQTVKLTPLPHDHQMHLDWAVTWRARSGSGSWSTEDQTHILKTESQLEAQDWVNQCQGQMLSWLCLSASTLWARDRSWSKQGSDQTNSSCKYTTVNTNSLKATGTANTAFLANECNRSAICKNGFSQFLQFFKFEKLKHFSVPQCQLSIKQNVLNSFIIHVKYLGIHQK